MAERAEYRPMAYPEALQNPRWYCPGCGAEHSVFGPAYPICDCGVRCRFVTADNLPYVDRVAGRPDNGAG